MCLYLKQTKMSSEDALNLTLAKIHLVNRIREPQEHENHLILTALSRRTSARGAYADDVERFLADLEIIVPLGPHPLRLADGTPSSVRQLITRNVIPCLQVG